MLNVELITNSGRQNHTEFLLGVNWWSALRSEELHFHEGVLTSRHCARELALATTAGFLAGYWLRGQRYGVDRMSGVGGGPHFALSSFDFGRQREKGLFHVHRVFGTRLQEGDGALVGKCLRSDRKWMKGWGKKINTISNHNSFCSSIDYGLALNWNTFFRMGCISGPTLRNTM